jgi:DNA-binding response OmpR family regulator
MSPGASINGVILAENDALMRGIIRTILLRAEQQVFPAADGLEAVTLAQQFLARLVILDIAMPRLSGLLACQAIRALRGYANVPIVILTGYSDEQMRLAAQRQGASDFITKPFRPNVLLAQLAPYLDVPPHLLPRGATDQNAALPGRHARVWKTHQGANVGQSGHPELTSGTEIMQPYREAERMA